MDSDYRLRGRGHGVVHQPGVDFIERHPTVKMLALAFLILIGTVLVAEGSASHVPRGYIYFAMGFSIFVEMLNLKARGRREQHV